MQFDVGLRCLFDKVYRVTEFYNKITVEHYECELCAHV